MTNTQNSTIPLFQWHGSESEPSGTAIYTVNNASMTMELPDFKTANSVHFLLKRAQDAGRFHALWEAKRAAVHAIGMLEDKA